MSTLLALLLATGISVATEAEGGSFPQTTVADRFSPRKGYFLRKKKWKKNWIYPLTPSRKSPSYPLGYRLKLTFSR